MIPGKSYSPDELVAIAWARKWLVLLCAIIGGGLAFGYARTLSPRYSSDTLILIIAQRVDPKYVNTTLNIRVEERLKSIAQEILGRTRLESIVAEFDLYRNLRGRRTSDEIVQRMRDDIDVKQMGGDAFRVSYVSDDARTAMRVTERLASLFIEENKTDQLGRTTAATQFLNAQLAETRVRLQEQETRLAEYRRLHNGELPTQLDSNQQVLQGTRLQLQNTQDSLVRDRDRRLALDREIAELAEADATGSTRITGSSSSAAGAPAAGTADQLERERATLKGLSARYTDAHPDVSSQARVVRDLEAQLARELADRRNNVAPPMATGPSSASIIRQNRLRELRNELDNTDRQIASKLADERRLRDSMAQLSRRIDATPTRETELISLTRDYDAITKLYNDLLQKKQASVIAGDMEQKDMGQKFEVLDAARMPTSPSSPNRPKLIGIGIAGGIGFALLLAAFFEYRNSALRDEDELSACTGLPVVAVIPLMVPKPVGGSTPRIRRLLGSFGGGRDLPATPNS